MNEKLLSFYYDFKEYIDEQDSLYIEGSIDRVESDLHSKKEVMNDIRYYLEVSEKIKKYAEELKTIVKE